MRWISSFKAVKAVKAPKTPKAPKAANANKAKASERVPSSAEKSEMGGEQEDD